MNDILLVTHQRYLQTGIKRQFAACDYGIDAATTPSLAQWRLDQAGLRPYRVALLDVHTPPLANERDEPLAFSDIAQAARWYGTTPLLLVSDGNLREYGFPKIRYTFQSESSPLLDIPELLAHLRAPNHRP